MEQQKHQQQIYININIKYIHTHIYSYRILNTQAIELLHLPAPRHGSVQYRVASSRRACMWFWAATGATQLLLLLLLPFSPLPVHIPVSRTLYYYEIIYGRSAYVYLYTYICECVCMRLTCAALYECECFQTICFGNGLKRMLPCRLWFSRRSDVE